MATTEKTTNKKSLCNKYNIKITVSEALTQEYSPNKVYFPKKLAEANAVINKVRFPEGFFDKETPKKQKQIA